MRRLSHNGTEVATYEEQEKCLANPVLAPGGLLFCVSYDADDTEQDEIIALDAQTLEPRYRFGRSLLNDACHMAVVGEELFVCDRDNDRLQVFSLAGEHRRSITGEWTKPALLCFAKDRLYLVEEEEGEDEEDEEEGEGEDGMQDNPRGKRIFVLSLQGDTLQVFTLPDAQVILSLCCFDNQLLVTCRSQADERAMLALSGV